MLICMTSVKSFSFQGNKIILRKILNKLDEFAINSCKLISKFFRYAVVGGYVAILFGRSRVTEDIDVIVDASGLNLVTIKSFYAELDRSNYWVFNALKPETGYRILKEGLGIRIAEKERAIPNIELKIAKRPLDEISLEESRIVEIEGEELVVGSLELNIAYKFYLGSIKDIEDAVYLYCLLYENLNRKKIVKYARSLGVDTKVVERYLRCD